MPSITELYDAEKSGLTVDSPAAPTSDSITSLYDAEKAQNKERLKAVLRTASDVKPADAVMAGKLAVKRDLPPDVVLRNLQEIQRQTDADDGADKMKFAPMLAERMQDLNFAQKAREDLESLVGLEENIKKFGALTATPKPKPTFLNVHQGLFKSVWRGLDSAKTGLAVEVGDLFSDGGFFGEEAQPYQFGAQRLGMWMEGRFNKQPSPGDEVRRADLVRKYLQAKGREEDDTPEFETETAASIYGGASSTLRMAPALALSVAAKSPTPMLAVMGGQTQADAYGKYAARGASGGEAFMAATAEGLIEVFTEKIPMSTTLKALGLGPGGMVKQVAKAGVQDQVGEFFATLGQDAVDTAFANPDKTWEQYWAERPARAYQTSIATLTQSALVGGGGAGAKYISQRYRHEDAKATDAEEFAKLVEAIRKHAEASQLNSMDATTFNQLMGEFAGETGEAPAEVYIDQGALVNSLNQSGMSITEFAALAPTVAEQLQREDLGAQVRVPVAEFLAVGPKVTESLVDSVRRAPDAMNRTEAKTWLESNGAPLRAEVEAEIQKQDDQETFRAGIASVRDAFKQELTRTKRFSASVNNAYADLMANYFGATASRLGMTPEALLDKYKLHVRSDVSGSARTMDQPAYHGGPHGDAARAQIGFGDDITKQASVMSLFAGADLSSFLHDGAHFFLEVHSDLAARIQQQIDSGASVSDQERGIVDDMRKLLGWFGVKGDENIDALNTWSMMRLEDKRQFHEQFARGFEAFAREGKAPTLALQSIFSRFGDWLKKIYESVKELNVSLNDDVRQVMGRMIATDRAIEETIAARNMGPLFSSAVDGESVGMTLEQYNAIQGLHQEAKDAAIAALQARSLKDMKWLSRAHDKALQERQREVDSLREAMRLEVAKEVMTEPVYQAWQFLTAKSDDAAEAGKLRTAELRETYGAAKDALWRPLSARKMTSDSGISPETLAERVGFDSGDALVKALVDATPPKEVIDTRTDRRMLEEYGDINSPEALRRAADEAVHDEMRARVVAAEMKALEGGTKVNERRGTTSVDVLNEAAKSYAEELIGTMRLRDIRPAQYQTAAGRSGKLAETALKAGKTEEAMLHKRNQLVNIHAARAASDAKRAEEQGHAFLKRVQKPGRIPADNFDQIISLLERFDLRKAATAGELDSRARFSTWAKEQIERGEVPPNVELLLSKAGKAKYIAELQLRNEDEELVYADAEKELLLLAGLLESDSVRSYKELTSNEFNGLVDTVRQIDHTGRRIEGVLTAKDKRTFKAELERISSHVKTVAEQRGRVATDTESESTIIGKMKEVMRGAFFSQVKTHNMVHIIDGGPGGPLHERLVATAGDASNAEQIDVGAYHDKVRALLDTLPDKGDFSNKAIFYEEIGKSLNKSEFFSTLAEMGNASNRQRLMGGTGWSEAQLDALAARATAQEWYVIQGLWDIYESLRPRVAALERKLRGVEPDWVQARSLVVNTADGKRITLRGGYSPVIYDPRSHGKSMGHADEKQGMDMVRFARGAATVNRSFTKPRVEEVKGRPLLRSFDAKLNAIQDTLHYLHWQEWVMDASRFVKHLDPVIREHYGHEPMVMLKTWVADMAGGMQAPRNAAETWMTSVSRNVSWTTLAFNLASAAGQVSGYTQSMVVLGEGGSAVSGSVWMAKGLAHVIASPKQAYKDAIAKSDFLLKRTTTRLQALAEISAQVKGDGKKMQAFKKAGWAPMLAMQTAVDIPTWWAGYEKAMADPANNGDEARAVMLADQVVKDSQGSGLQMDLTAVERSTGALRLFTGFMMFMNTTMNLNYRVLRNDTSMGRKALDLVLLNIIPVMIGLSIRALLTPGDADKDEEQLAKRYAREQVAFILGQMVGFRELSGLVNAFANKPGGDYGGPVGLRGLADMYKLAKQIGQGEIDAQAVKSAVSVMGDLGVPIPSSAVNKAITGGEALVKDKTDNPAAVVFGFQKPH